MRDYKNVKVPRRYRAASNKTTVVKRVAAGQRGPSGFKGAGGKVARLLMIIAIAAGSYMGWLGYKWFSRSEAFLIEAVEIQGVRRLTEKDFSIFREAFAGQNIFLVDLNSVAARAAEHPWVKDIRIFRGLPNKIRVQITEREPAALLETQAGAYIIDETGMVMERFARQKELPGLPTISAGRQGTSTSIGREIDSRAVKEALSLICELSKRGGWDISRVRVKAETPESITIVYADKEFRMGSGNYPEKLKRLSEIALDMKRRGRDFAYVDLRPARQAAVKVK